MLALLDRSIQRLADLPEIWGMVIFAGLFFVWLAWLLAMGGPA